MKKTTDVAQVKSLGLALSGGAARGIAHIGAITELLNHKIRIDYIAATSVGSLVGAMLATGQTTETMLRVGTSIHWSDLAGFHLSRNSLVSSKPIETLALKLLGDITFKDLKIPFSPLATDLYTGRSVCLNFSDLTIARAIRASASFPGFFSPVKINDRYYIDGGAQNNCPADVVRDMGADVVLAIDVIPDVELKELPLNLLHITDRAMDILLRKSSILNQQCADIVLRPVIEDISSFNLKEAEKLIEFGKLAVKKNIGKLKKLLR